MPEILDSKYDLTANTYTAKEQSFAVCEVGDAKQPDKFYPQVKIMRWDNEANFSARLMHEEETPAVALVDNKIQWAGSKVEAHFYEIGEGKEGGGFEFEVIFKEPPKSNVVSMTLQTKGLDFFYQPELTAAELLEGSERPDNVVGSYAVYHQTAAGDYTALGGKNYKAGKAFHIYRPRIEDAGGNWVWGELHIDPVAEMLTVTIPQKFLDTAIYPVRHAAGLEFGYHTYGATDYANKPYIYYCKSVTGGGAPATPAVDGNLTNIWVYAKISYGTPNVIAALYADSAGEPSTRREYLTTGPAAGAAYAWIPIPISTPVVAGTQYHYGIGVENGVLSVTSITYAVDTTGSSTTRLYSGVVSFPAPANWSNVYNWLYGIYAEYTPAGQATAKRFGGVPHMAINRGVW